ncbi:MAG TPA: DUF6151 family protein [Steroidobacteraceae bacterium]|nr:DUF6151 family protein [Steroidobacteraceae bacterium]
MKTGDAVLNLSIRCECGAVTGMVEARGLAVHGTCYCRDCQAFARFLGRPGRMLDDAGGTEVIGTLPARIHFTSGEDRLACITLTSRGPYRWYAECCRMAICNSGRTRNAAFATLHRRALAASSAAVDRAFGPPGFVFGARGATAPVKVPRLGLVTAAPKILWNILHARISGSWRSSPFFTPGTDEPIRAPRVLSQQERHALRGGDTPRS